MFYQYKLSAFIIIHSAEKQRLVLVLGVNCINNQYNGNEMNVFLSFLHILIVNNVSSRFYKVKSKRSSYSGYLSRRDLVLLAIGYKQK